MIKRCAIYCRKSTEDGLDQVFNSLDAQREACEAYIASQRGEGWRPIKVRYDDGGLSGGNMERPALKHLLQDIDDGKVDIVIVYKVDRLTRSLMDFAKLVERFDRHEVSFVSVTQAFNTSNSMGRLTLNVLLSFAQFEREVGAERVRDKIAASRKKGIWTGGNAPLGYDNVEKKLVVIEAEARIVREIFKQYADHRSVPEIVRYARAQGWVTKRRPNGTGGKQFSRGPVYHMLKNPIYAGLMQTGGKFYDGEHQAIIDRILWDEVQAKLKANTQWNGKIKNLKSPLAGLLYWDDQRMTPDQAKKAGRRYRYYVTNKNNEGSAKPIRLKAGDVESAVRQAIDDWLAKPEAALDAVLKTNAWTQSTAPILTALKRISKTGAAAGKEEKCKELRPWLEKIVLNDHQLTITVNPKRMLALGDHAVALKAETAITKPIALKNRKHETKLILGGLEPTPILDKKLIALITKAHRWKMQWIKSEQISMEDLAKQHSLSKSDVSKQIRLAYLAPDIIERILNGDIPIELTAERLRRLTELPADWSQQREILGFD